MKKIRKKLYAGKPNLGEGWDPLGLTPELYGTQWFASIRRVSERAEWRSVKIVAYSQDVPYKANYWTAWNGERLGESRDVQVMRETRPDLIPAVIDLIKRAEAAAA